MEYFFFVIIFEKGKNMFSGDNEVCRKDFAWIGLDFQLCVLETLLLPRFFFLINFRVKMSLKTMGSTEHIEM